MNPAPMGRDIIKIYEIEFSLSYYLMECFMCFSNNAFHNHYSGYKSIRFVNDKEQPKLEILNGLLNDEIVVVVPFT